MIKFVIIADDLTGSLDTGVQFSKKKISTIVTTDLNFSPNELPKNIEVLVVNTESRHISKEKAENKIASVITKFKNIPIEYFYKKIDSTFRGNIGIELKSFMENLNINKLPLIPALPKNGRIVKEGILYVNNKKISETEFANDILNPITDDYLPNILKKDTDLEIKVNNYDFNDSDKTIYLFDSENKKDMNKIKELLVLNNLLKYTSGSAGFAEILADNFKTKNEIKKINFTDERVLFICGSLNKISIEQCKYMENKGLNSKKIDLEYKKILNNEVPYNSLFNTKNFNSIINKDKYFLLKTSNCENIEKEYLKYIKEKNIDIKDLTSTVSRYIGEITKKLVISNDLKNLVVFGGDTLNEILRSLQATSIIPTEELAPGVVLAKVFCKDRKLNIITKAGGFGKINIIEDIIAYIKNNLKGGK